MNNDIDVNKKKKQQGDISYIVVIFNTFTNTDYVL